MTNRADTSIQVAIADIDVGERDRSDMGDLTELAESIRRVGLLHPIVITGEFRLVAGDRRLAAVRDVLGWTEVPVTMVDIYSARDVLQAEWDENTCRQPLNPVEAERAQARRAHVLVDDALRRRADALARGRATMAAGTGSPDVGEPVAESAAERKARETDRIAATGTGYSATTLAKIRDMRSAADGVLHVGGQRLPAPEPVREAAREALAEVEAGTPVERAHRRVSEVVEQHVEPDPDRLRTRQLKAWRDALGGARMLREFDMSLLPELLSEQEWASATQLMDATEAQVEAFREARPNHLRVVQGA